MSRLGYLGGVGVRTLEDFERIEESEIKARAEATGADSLDKLLRVATEWREAGCTPVFIIAQYNPTVIACVAEETFGQYYQ